MRYAIYYTPPEHDHLTQTATRWLGRSAFSGKQFPNVPAGGFSGAEIGKLTADPRRYGFHATLKAPFSLVHDKTQSELIETFDHFALSQSAFEIEALVLGSIGHFFALVPANRSGNLQALADSAVRTFEPFRAPLSERDFQRRKPETLTERQRNYLQSFDYPYVFEEFRFHMTLTGAIPQERFHAMHDLLADCFREFTDRPTPISHVALFVERDADGPFTVMRLAELKGSAIFTV